MNYKAIVEGLLFVVGDEGITVEELRKILELDNETLKQIFLELKRDYDKPDRGLRISYLGNAFKLTTKEEHKEFYEKLAEEQRDIIDEAAEVAIEYARKASDSRISEKIDIIKESGTEIIKISDELRNKMFNASRGIYDNITNIVGDKLVDLYINKN